MDPAVTIPQHTTPAERAAAAAAFAAEYTDRFSWPMACDTMDGAFLSTFGAWPTRFFAVADGKVAFKIEPNAGLDTAFCSVRRLNGTPERLYFL